MPHPGAPSLSYRLLATGHFRERAGYATWRARGTPDWLVIYTCSGRGRFGHERGEMIVEPSDVTLLRPGTLHDYGVEPTLQRWELLWAHFRPYPHWLEWLDWPEEAPGLMRLRLGPVAANLVRRRLQAMYRLASGGLRRREELAMNALEEVLLRCDLEAPPSGAARLDERIRRAVDYLCQNHARSISLRGLAEECGLSVSRLAHLFRRQVGQTPQRFLEQQRLTRARQLLELTSRSVKEIAYEVGFASPFYFTLRFKKQTGQCPRQYRRARGSY